jgi:cytochrome c oxidase assembly protein Cox11
LLGINRKNGTAGEERLLTLAFTVSPQLPPEQETLSISYTFFKLENPSEGES